MKFPQIVVAGLLALATGTAFAQSGNGTSTTSNGTVGTQNGVQSGTTTAPGTMPSGASIGNNRDVLSPGTGTAPTQTTGSAATPNRKMHRSDKGMHKGKTKAK